MEFLKERSVIQLIIATTAFGMGIDCQQIYHCGPPHTVEQYVQEVGRAGQNKQQSNATLIYNKPRGDITDDMRDYGKNTSMCRRQLLHKSLLFHEETSNLSPNHCCDICAVD